MPNDDQAEADSREETGPDMESYRREVAEILEQGGEPAEDEEDAEAGEDEEEQQPDETARPKERYRFKDPLDQAVAALAKARGIPLTEAARIIGQEAEAAGPVPLPPAGGRRRDEIAREIERVRQERKEALADLEFEKLGELDDRLETLREEREQLHVREAAEAAGRMWERQAELDAAFDESMARAMAHFPDLGDPDSAMYQLVLAMDEHECRMGGPLANSADKPFQLAWNAARELGIAMSDPAAAKQERKPAGRKPVGPASGAARTSAATAPETRLEKALEGVRTAEDYERLLEFLGAAV